MSGLLHLLISTSLSRGSIASTTVIYGRDLLLPPGNRSDFLAFLYILTVTMI
jgi:hypothetical protein